MVEVLRCLYPDCGREAAIRGLCHICYMTAARLVHRQKVTWAVLEERGKCLPRQVGRRGRQKRWFLA